VLAKTSQYHGTDIYELVYYVLAYRAELVLCSTTTSSYINTLEVMNECAGNGPSVPRATAVVHTIYVHVSDRQYGTTEYFRYSVHVPWCLFVYYVVVAKDVVIAAISLHAYELAWLTRTHTHA
jgi:hypothetical protein